MLLPACAGAKVLRFLHPTNVEGKGPLGWKEEEKLAGKRVWGGSSVPALPAWTRLLLQWACMARMGTHALFLIHCFKMFMPQMCHRRAP